MTVRRSKRGSCGDHRSAHQIASTCTTLLVSDGGKNPATQRQCRSLQSIMGAQQMRLSMCFMLCIFFAIVGPVEYWIDNPANHAPSQFGGE